MDWLQFKDAVLQFLAVGSISLFAYEVRRIRESIDELNIKIAIVIRDVENHEHRIERLEDGKIRV